MVNQITQKTRT